jgi:hypothetical protein
MSVSEKRLLDVFAEEMESHGVFELAWQLVEMELERSKESQSSDLFEYLLHGPAPLQIPDPKLLQQYLPKDRKPTREEIEAAWRKAK